MEERWKASSLEFEVKKKGQANCKSQQLLTGERWRLGIERAQPLQLGSKEVIMFNNEFLQRAAWWKELQQKSDDLFSSSGKSGPSFAQFPKMREKMKSYLLFVFRLKAVSLVVRPWGKLKKPGQ